MHDRETVTKALRLVEVVGRQHDRDAGAFELLDQRPCVAATFGVEARRRFVEEQHAWLADDRARQVESTLFSTGEELHAGIGSIGQIDTSEHVAGRKRIAAGTCPHLKALKRGQIGRQTALLQHDAKVRAYIPSLSIGVHTHDGYRSLAWQ